MEAEAMAGQRQAQANRAGAAKQVAAGTHIAGMDRVMGDGTTARHDRLLVWSGRFSVALWLVFSLFHYGYFEESERVYGLIAVLPCLAVVVTWAVVHQNDLSSLSSLGRILVGVGAVLLVSLVFSTYVHASYVELLSFVALAALSGAAFVGFGSSSGLVPLLALLVAVGTCIPVAGLVSVALARIPGLTLPLILQRASAMAGGRLNSVFGYSNTLASFLVLPMMVSAGFAVGGQTPRMRMAGIVTGVFMTAAFLMTQSRASVVVVLVGLLAVGVAAMVRGFLAVQDRRRIALGFAGIAAAVGVIAAVPSLRQAVIAPLLARLSSGFQDITSESGLLAGQFGDRLRMILDGLRYWSHYPVLGTGAGTYEFNYMRFRTQMFFSTDPHALPVKILAETGTVGALAWLVLLIGLLAFIARCVRSDERHRVLLLFALVGLCTQLLHACLDWDWLFMVYPSMLFVMGGAAVGAMKGGVDPVSRVVLGWFSHRTTVDGGRARPKATTQHGSLPSGSSRWLVPVSLCIMALMYLVAVSLLGVSLKYLQRAERQEQSSDIVLARENYARAISVDPGNARLHYQLAQNLNVIDQKVYNGSFLPIRDTIKTEYKQAILLNRWYPLYLWDYVAFLMRTGDADATDVCARLVQANPADPDVYAAGAACAHSFAHDNTLAQQYVDQALALDPSNFVALQVQGTIREAAGDFAAALGAYRAAMRVKPEEPQPYVLAGHLLEVQQRTVEATLLYSEGISATGGDSALVQSLERLGPYVRVTMPAGTWSLAAGEHMDVQWSVASAVAAKGFAVDFAPATGSTSYALADHLSSSTHSASLTIPVDTPPGSYRVRVWAYVVGSPQRVSFGDSSSGTVTKR
jgi:tetratricopeptide (TPR) repeat protein